MGLPSKLKNFNVFNDGESYMGKVGEAVLPKLTRKMEEWRGGGMNGPVQMDFGTEALEMECTYGGLMRRVLQQYGHKRHDGVMLRFAGAYTAEDADQVDAVEVVVRGRYKEIDFGTGKAGDDTAFKTVLAVSYYKLTINGEVLIEIDIMNLVEKVNGQDLLADIRRALGV